MSTSHRHQLITSIDPGETAGVVRAVLLPLGMFPTDLLIEWTGEVVWDDWEAWKDISESSEIVICENFRLRPAKARHLGGSILPTVRLIGFLQGHSALSTPPKEFILSEPANMQAFPRSALKELGPDYDHPSKHVRAAMAHLLWYTKRLR